MTTNLPAGAPATTATSTDWESSTAIQVLKSALICFFIVLAILGNACVIYAVKNYKKLQTIPNYFVFNLAVADFLYAATGMPMLLVTYIAKEWVLGSFMCNFNGLCNSLFCVVSIWTLVMISVNRYFAVARARDIKRMYTKQRSFMIIGGVWAFAFLVAVPPLLGWSEFISGTNFCTVNGKADLSYSVFLAFMGYILPIIAMTGLYLKIFFLIKKHKRFMKQANVTSYVDKYEESSTSDPDSQASAGGKDYSINREVSKKDKKQLDKFHHASNGHEIRNNMLSVTSIEMHPYGNSRTLSRTVFDDNENIPDRKKTISFSESPPNKSPVTQRPRKTSSAVKKFFKEARVTKMLLVVVFCFFVCWTPFMISSVLYGIGAKPENFQLMTFGIIIACLNSVINPIIYAVMNHNFRVVFQAMLLDLKHFKFWHRK